MAKSRLILNPENKETNVATSVKEKVVTPKIPNEYIPITLPTLGKLSAPKVLHFRDYTMSDALELNVLDEDERLKALVTVLNNMCYEKFDCSQLHINELMVVLYTIHATFISNRIEKEYYIDDMLPDGKEEGQLQHPDNISSVDLFINKFDIKTIDEDEEGNKLKLEFKEPFSFIDDITKNKLTFRLSRVEDLLLAQDHCNEVFEKELFRFKPLKRQIESLKKIKYVN